MTDSAESNARSTSSQDEVISTRAHASRRPSSGVRARRGGPGELTPPDGTELEDEERRRESRAPPPREGWGSQYAYHDETTDESLVFLRVPSTLRCRSLVGAAIRAACATAVERLDRTLDPGVEVALLTAAGEVFNNLVEHGFAVDAGVVELEVILRAEQDRMEVVFRDRGAAFDPSSAPSPNLRALPENGMGLYLARAAVDELTYRPGDPNELTLCKRLLPVRKPGDPER